MFILEDEKLNAQCRELGKRFSTRFPGLSLVWSQIDRANKDDCQKFRLVETVSGKKLRLVFISNESFEDETIGSFLSKFEDFLGTITGGSPGNIYYKNAKLGIKILRTEGN